MLWQIFQIEGVTEVKLSLNADDIAELIKGGALVSIIKADEEGREVKLVVAMSGAWR